MDPVKDAFQKVKQDIESLRKEKDLLRLRLAGLQDRLENIYRVLDEINKKTDYLVKTKEKEDKTSKQTIATHPLNSSTHNYPFEALKPQNLLISTGNQGVPTDKQTDRQTDRHIENYPKNTQIIPENIKVKDPNPITNAARILESLDSLKKEIRLKFKRLTDKEWLVFSTMYQLDEEIGYSDYKSLSQALNLTESSIRDYVGRIMRKGIPVDKNKINNKYIRLNISDNLKKIASLSIILQLRDL